MITYPQTSLDHYYSLCEELSLTSSNDLLTVSLAEFSLTHFNNNTPLNSFPITFSENPLSLIENSLGTPYGLFQIKEKHGHDAPLGAVFKGRKIVANHFSNYQKLPEERGMITSRILWLDGLQPHVNDNTFSRYVYIHASDREDWILFQRRFSKGCILMLNQDIIDLFDLLPTGTHVFIDSSGIDGH